jgi:hypothetical protein
MIVDVTAQQRREWEVPSSGAQTIHDTDLVNDKVFAVLPKKSLLNPLDSDSLPGRLNETQRNAAESTFADVTAGNNVLGV